MYFEGNGGLPPTMFIERAPASVRFIAKDDPSRFIAIHPDAMGNVEIQASPALKDLKVGGALIGGEKFKPDSIAEIWHAVRDVFSSAPTRFQPGDEARMRSDAPTEFHPGEAVSIIGVLEPWERYGELKEEFPEGMTYVVEYKDGTSGDVAEDMVESV